MLETDYETDEGAVTVIDCMPPQPRARPGAQVGRRGQVPMHMDLAIRFDYGSIIPWVRRVEQGMQAVAGPDTLRLHTDVALRGADFTTVADFTVTPGQRVPFVLSWHPSQEPAPPPIDPEDTIRHTERWWREWSDRCTYEGPREAVLRSLITLKALTYAPTGGIVAAPTTSFRSNWGGVRNWDYRYCWVRDATFTLYALMMGGYTEEAGPGASGCCVRGGEAVAAQHHVRAGRGTAAAGTGPGMAAGLRGLVAGADRQRGLPAVPAGCVWRSHGCVAPGGRWDWNPMRMPGGWSAPCSITWRGPGKSPMRGSGRCAGHAGTSHSKVMAWGGRGPDGQGGGTLRAAGAGRALARPACRHP